MTRAARNMHVCASSETGISMQNQTDSTKPAFKGRALLLGIFVLSGFAGLIYQSIWSQYLGIFLGHAAYAQALVLAIFMGDMAAGAKDREIGSRSSSNVRIKIVLERDATH